jgi:deferrochelatase/peroxidase EfeB
MTNHAIDSESRLQEGIYFQKQPRIGPCYRLALMDVKDGASWSEARTALEEVWRTLRAVGPHLVAGGGGALSDPELTCLLGFGARLFKRYPELGEPPLALKELAKQPFPSLDRVAGPDQREGETQLAIQLIAKTELAVNQAVAELWMLTRSQPLELVTVHEGFKRGDGRSWIGFHDGISNIERGRRRQAIEVVQDDPVWMKGGTYMAFLRVELDLGAWRGLRLEHQESLVGRKRDTGCPLARIDPPMSPVALDVAPDAPEYINPPPVLGAGPEKDLLRASHIYRANPNRFHPHHAPLASEDDRIFRQGFDFAEPLPGKRFRVGLNFVSFQRDLALLTNIFLKSGWLRDVNFGGDPDAAAGQPRPITLIKLIAGGLYAVPPKDEPFPGARLFKAPG